MNISLKWMMAVNLFVAATCGAGALALTFFYAPHMSQSADRCEVLNSRLYRMPDTPNLRQIAKTQGDANVAFLRSSACVAYSLAKMCGAIVFTCALNGFVFFRLRRPSKSSQATIC